MDDSFFASDLLSEFEAVDAEYSPQSSETQQGDHSIIGGSDDGEDDSDSCGAVNLSVREEDEAEENFIDIFMRQTCRCHFGLNGRSCSCQFTREMIAASRMNCREMAKDELDLVILTHLQANRRCFEDQGGSRVCINYWFLGYKVCKTTYLFLYDMGPKRYKNLIEHFSQYGLVSRVHGNTKRLPPNTIPFTISQDIVQFITNFATIHALPLPGRLPGQFSDDKALLLPTYMNKRHVYRMYCEASANDYVSRRKFETLWNELVPHISCMKPATDLCEVCHLNIVKITRSANLPLSEKSEQFLEAERHLELAKQEREVYNGACLSSAEELKNNPCNPNLTHISFDYAQQLHFPSSPQQVGPLYFLTPRKCQLFGITNEAKGEQVNYLIDESDSVGKGANAVVSLVHHYLESHISSPNQQLLFNADNCVGQNKNNCLMQYLMWRVLMGKTFEIKIAFMVAGHTKFAPDRFFGLVKKAYRSTSVSSLPDLEKTVSNSSIAGKNLPQVTVNATTGQRYVTWYDWSRFLGSYFNAIPGILRYHHFRFDSKSPGVVFVKEYSSSPEEALTMCSDISTLDISAMPEIIQPPGMTIQRQIYLYEKIRKFCSSDTAKELTCPQPQQRLHASELPSAEEPRSKSERKCSHCRQTGHTKTVKGAITCPQLL